MRSETEMFDMILTKARSDERIRAVLLNGSRTNPNAPRDLFQDYDIVYLVTDMDSFTRNHRWIDSFGERTILQLPDAMGDPPPTGDGSFGYLIQFADGNRIDLTLLPLSMADTVGNDSLTVLLLDKDSRFPPLPPPTDTSYLPQPPTAQQFDDCCNEFWWVSTYVAKGLWRKELTYAKHHLDVYVRDQLMKMATWYVGMRTGYTASPGKDGKYLERFLEPELWRMLLATYADADYQHTWDALERMGQLFRTIALPIAAQYGFSYPHDDDTRVTAHLQRVRQLPDDATSF